MAAALQESTIQLILLFIAMFIGVCGLAMYFMWKKIIGNWQS